MSERDPVTLRAVERGATDLLGDALSGLAKRIRGQVAEADQQASGEPVNWIALVEEIRRHAANLGVRERSGEVDDFGLDPEFLRSARPLLGLLRRRWFRIEVTGAAPTPDTGPTLFVANRSGILPWDGLMISEEVAERTEGRDRPRFLIADWLIRLPYVQAGLARLGGIRACRENAQRVLAANHSVVAFPEGLKGAGKLYRERYRLKGFGRGGVVRVALETGVPLVPVAVLGAEEAHPILFKSENLARRIGLPFMPITPTFPLLGPLGAIPLPSKWSLVFGKPIETANLGPAAAQDELLVSRLNDQLRNEVQRLLDDALHARDAPSPG